MWMGHISIFDTRLNAVAETIVILKDYAGYRCQRIVWQPLLFRDSEPHFDLDGVYCAAESIELFRFAYK